MTWPMFTTKEGFPSTSAIPNVFTCDIKNDRAGSSTRTHRGGQMRYITTATSSQFSCSSLSDVEGGVQLTHLHLVQKFKVRFNECTKARHEIFVHIEATQPLLQALLHDNPDRHR